jgi:excisionase family DNA binding protein
LTNGDHWRTVAAMAEQERIALSIAEAAEQVGMSEKTIRDWIKAGKFPAVQLGGRKGRWLVPVDALRRWLDDRSTAA